MAVNTHATILEPRSFSHQEKDELRALIREELAPMVNRLDEIAAPIIREVQELKQLVVSLSLRCALMKEW